MAFWATYKIAQPIQPIWQHIFALPCSALKKPPSSISSIFLESPHQVDMKNAVKSSKYWSEFFQRVSIKRPGPSQFYVQLQKIVLSLLNDLVSFKGPGLYLTTWSIFFEISNMRTISGLTILSNDLVSIKQPVLSFLKCQIWGRFLIKTTWYEILPKRIY